jgi:hypothetical protein
MKPIYRMFAKILPKKIRNKIKNYLRYTTVKSESDVLIGLVIFLALFLGFGIGLVLSTLLERSVWLTYPGSAVIIIGLSYMLLFLQMDKKARLIEESLPDALQLMASNLRAGMTPDKALLLSSRPEFGILKDEIDIVGKKITLGTNIGGALTEMSQRVRSRRLSRAVELINSGLDSGGSLAILLETTSNTLREQFLVDKKIKAGVNMYVIFIFSAAAVITPALFGLSSFLVDILKSSLSQIDLPSSSTAAIPINIGEIKITSKFLIQYIITFLTINGFMASMILGLIAKGKKREGLSYFIPLILLAIPLFLLARYLIKASIGGLFNF